MPPATSGLVTGLTNNISYKFRVAAVNLTGSSDYSIASSSVIPLASPTTIPGLQLWLDA